LSVIAVIALLHKEVFAFNIAELAHALDKGGITTSVNRGLSRTAVEEPNAPDFALLLSDGAERRRECACAKREDKSAPLVHSITLSAQKNSNCGMATVLDI